MRKGRSSRRKGTDRRERVEAALRRIVAEDAELLNRLRGQ